MSGPAEDSDRIRALEEALGTTVRSMRRVAGGDIATSHRAELRDGASVFLKDYGEGMDGVGAAEAEGLAWIAAANALRTPRVLAHGSNWLALEWIRPAAARSDFAEQLGDGLARLHQVVETDFGGCGDNWIGRLSQHNPDESDWAHFYAEHRIRPLMRHAVARSLLPSSVSRRLEFICESMSELVGVAPVPSRLHGDLWSGNVMVDETGGPCLIDPSAYAGHREVDLAMMNLFGGFNPRTYSAYEERWPLSDGYESRVALYQLYPILVHVCLFGGSYVDRLRRTALDVRTPAID